jgi:hypothetical protein
LRSNSDSFVATQINIGSCLGGFVASILLSLSGCICLFNASYNPNFIWEWEWRSHGIYKQKATKEGIIITENLTAPCPPFMIFLAS